MERAGNPAGRARQVAPRRGASRYFRQIDTRWMDADVYGHVNNVVYYSYFDTAVNGYLVEQAGLDPTRADVVGLVVATSCEFKQSVTFPETIDVGISVTRIGTSSVAYDIGIFKHGDEEAAAFGHFVHVYVERATQRPTTIPAAHRDALEKLRA